MNYQDELFTSDYKNVLKYFTEISAVPRGSDYNSKISSFLIEFAKKNNLEYKTDKAENVIIYKKATKGYEDIAPVIIQGHMDMVCVKTEESKHDFENEGLELFVENGMLGAKGTTLGGDDGIALAYGMALLTDDTLEHPALEFVATTDEETGLYGAKALDAEMLKGKYLVNVDSEDEGVVLLSCAGGLRVTGYTDITRSVMEGTAYNIYISGLQGGHSGAEIHKNRTNAVILMGRLLNNIDSEINISLADMSGGEKDNAIPDKAEAEIVISEENINKFEDIFNRCAQMLTNELSASEPELLIMAVKGNTGMHEAVLPKCKEQIITVLMTAPNGVQVMSEEIEGLVESSLNLGVFRMEDKQTQIHYSVRSSKTTYKYYIKDVLVKLYTAIGGRCETGAEYPAWEYKAESKLRKLYEEAYYAIKSEKPVFQAIHAGLECGILSEKIPDLDIISIGPDMKDIHTTKERLSIQSSINVYKSIEALLKRMSDSTKK